MYKKGIFLFFIILLAGCQPQELQIETTEPVSSPISTEVENSEPAEDTRPLYVSNAKPRELYIQAGDINILSTTVKYCWSEEPEECMGELNLDPKEAMINDRIFSIKPSSPMYYSLLTSNFGSTLPFPTNIELFSYKDGTYTPVDVPVGEEASFQGPAEEGNYVYVLKATYEGDVNGITFYAFQFRVRE